MSKQKKPTQPTLEDDPILNSLLMYARAVADLWAQEVHAAVRQALELARENARSLEHLPAVNSKQEQDQVN